MNLAGRVWGQPELVRVKTQELTGLFSDYLFNISKITALGYAPRIDARGGLENALRRRAESSRAAHGAPAGVATRSE